MQKNQSPTTITQNKQKLYDPINNMSKVCKRTLCLCVGVGWLDDGGGGGDAAGYCGVIEKPAKQNTGPSWLGRITSILWA